MPVGIAPVGWGSNVSLTMASRTAIGDVYNGLLRCFLTTTRQVTTVSFDLNARLMQRLQYFGIGGVRGVLWHQGESDAASSTPAGVYSADLQTVIDESRAAAGYDVPWFVGHPYLGTEGPAYAAVFQGQEALINNVDVFEGAQTGDLGPSDRWDGLHFNVAGLQAEGVKWFSAVVAAAQTYESNWPVAWSSGGTNTLQVQLPPTCDVSITPATVQPGQAFTVAYQSFNATSMTGAALLNGTYAIGPGPVALSGSPQGSLATLGSDTGKLTAQGTGGSSSCFANVTVGTPTPSCSISITPATVQPGQTFTVAYQSSNATSMTGEAFLNGALFIGSGPVALSGSPTTSLTAPGTYEWEMTPQGASGTGPSCTSTVTVEPTTPPPPTPSCSISITPATVQPGQTFTVAYQSSNATSMTGEAFLNRGALHRFRPGRSQRLTHDLAHDPRHIRVGNDAARCERHRPFLHLDGDGELETQTSRKLYNVLNFVNVAPFFRTCNSVRVFISVTNLYVDITE